LTVDHRRLGVDLFNEVWRLMETRADDDRMLHAAHASRRRRGGWLEGEGAGRRRRDRRSGGPRALRRGLRDAAMSKA
jgi:hypothetical protein